MHTNRLKLILFLLIGFLSSCQFGDRENKGAGGERLVCLSKQLTEVLYALGQGNRIVGLDLTSSYPEATRSVTKVGYHRKLNAEGIISLDPTLVVHQGDIAPAEVIPQIENVGLKVKQYPAAAGLDSTKILIRMVAKDYGADSTAARLIRELDSDLARADSLVRLYSTRPRVLIIHFGQQRNQYFVMGTRGTADAMLKLAGGVNAADTSSFRDLSAEVIAREQPDVILATDFGFDRMGSVEQFMMLPGLALTPAAKNGRIYRVEEHDLVYFGPRSGKTILKLAALIHQ